MSFKNGLVILAERTFLFLLISLLLGPSLHGQNYITLRGKVTSTEGNVEISDVQVGIKGKNTNVFTGTQGSFDLRVPAEFPLIIQLSHPQFRTASIIVEEPGGSLNINMDRRSGSSDGVQAGIIRIFGTVRDQDSNPMRNANLIVDHLQATSRSVGTNSNKDGEFSLFFNDVLPVILEVSSVGFEKQRVVISERDTKNLTVTMGLTSLGLREVVIRGDKVEEEILRADYAIEKLDIQELQLAPSFDFYDAVAGLKDVDVATQSMQFQSINARGFNATGNVRFTQMIDGMDNQAPGFGFSMGNFAGVSELDIESIELIPGPTSAHHGLNIFNGILFMKSKDPFLFEGLSGTLKLAANRFPEGGSGSSFFELQGSGVYDFSVRYAKALSPKLAFKVTGSMISAQDWTANNFDNIGVGERFEQHPDIPGYDGVNVYGDEVQALLPLGDFGANVTVTRTGYAEEDLFDYDFTNYKLSGAVHYKIKEDLRLVLQGNYGKGNTFYTGDNRLFLRNFQLSQTKAELQGSRLNIRTYYTLQNSGESFDGRFLALQLMRSARSDEDWFRVYQAAFEGLLISRGVNGGDHKIARAAADSNIQLNSPASARLEPGTDVFNAAYQRIVNTRGFEEGAAFKDNTSLYHVDGSYDFSGMWRFADLSVGANYRFFDPESSGVLFPDSTGNDITMFEYGGFIQLRKKLMEEKLQITASTRFDKNENFDPRVTPRFSLLYRYRNDHNFRLSFQNGFRFPNLRETFTFQNLGSAWLVGGLGPLIEPLDLAGTAMFQQAVDEFNRQVAIAINPDPEVNPVRFNQDQAEFLNLPILEAGLVAPGDIQAIRPEQIRTIEFGYKSVLSNKRLFVDLTYYHNTYDDFIGIIRVIKPKTSPQLDLFVAARQVNNSTEREQFFIYNNARETVRSQGISANVDYTSTGGFVLGVNAAWAALSSDPSDPIIPGFNTPSFKANYTLGHNNITKNLGFKINVRTRSSYPWESNFGDGEVDSYFNIDMQLNLRLPAIHSLIKAGMSNLGNEYYDNTFGGPRIGALPYIQITYDPMFY